MLPIGRLFLKRFYWSYVLTVIDKCKSVGVLEYGSSVFNVNFNLNILLIKIIMKIYTYFGEFYWFNVYILGYLDSFLKNYTDDEPLVILTLPDYAFILEHYFKNNKKIQILGKDDTTYISYRRGHHGNPNSGDEKNFDSILKYGSVHMESNLLFTNSWLENTHCYLAWIKENKLNEYGDPIDTQYTTEPVPDNTLKSSYSLYEYLLKKHSDKPWLKYYSHNENTLFDLVTDLFKKETLSISHHQITRIIERSPIPNTYIHIFPRNRGGHWNTGHISHIGEDNWIRICKLLKDKYPNRQICCHGHMESFQNNLNDYIDIKVKNIEESINLFHKSDILISPASGLVELAVNCGIKKIIYISENSLPRWTNNPFNVERNYVNINNDWSKFVSYCNSL